jgi:hypothetical protein
VVFVINADHAIEHIENAAMALKHATA